MTQHRNHCQRPSRIVKLAEPLPDPLHRPFDPEMLFVECGRCGAPVLWDAGRTTRLLDEAGIDPLELDPSCILVTNGCALCSQGPFTVRIFRLSGSDGKMRPLTFANA